LGASTETGEVAIFGHQHIRFRCGVGKELPMA
jgi:hypothetical protein